MGGGTGGGEGGTYQTTHRTPRSFIRTMSVLRSRQTALLVVDLSVSDSLTIGGASMDGDELRKGCTFLSGTRRHEHIA